MFDKGRLCLKIAGRDAGMKCVVVEKLEGKYVMVDGMTRRRKCNTLHLEPLDITMDIGDGTHESVLKAFNDAGYLVVAKKTKAKTTKPKAVRNVKEKPKPKIAKKTSEKKKPEAKVEEKKPVVNNEAKAPEHKKVQEPKTEKPAAKK